MGQKVHPIGFRLGISKMHLSQWFAQKEDYSTYLLEDNFLRKTLQKRYKQIEKIEIFRKIKDYLKIKISLENTEILIGRRGRKLLKFHQEIKQILQKYRRKISANENIKVQLYVRNDPKSQPSASFIATFLKNLLEKRTSYRRALNLVFKKKLNFRKARFKGIKVQISGRLNGAEIARREWVREGALPLQTLNANVDYIYKQARTIYGILGIKVWVFYK